MRDLRPASARLAIRTILCAWLACAGIAVAGVDRAEVWPEATLDAIRNAGVDVSAAVVVDAVELDLGPGTLRIERGVLVPATPANGRVLEFVFLGRARFEIVPPDRVEAGQLELFTGTPYLNEPVDAAVLVIGSGAVVRDLLDRDRASLDAARAERARALFSTWRERPERRKQATEAALFRAALGDVAAQRYLGLWCRNDRHGDFFYQLDPDELEPVSLGQFVPFADEDWKKRRLSRHLKAEQRRGRWIGMRAEDLGVWDVWLSTTPLDERGRPKHGDQGLEPRSYALDVRLDPDRESIEGVATIDLVFEQSGRRAIAFDLHRDLEVERVTDRRGDDLYHFRSGERVIVLLAEPMRRGATESLEFAYAGSILRRTGHRDFALRDTSRWYPRCGTLDRATYEMRFRWPKRYDLMASGRRVDGGRKDGERWERRRLDIPGIAVSFEVGKFVEQTETVAGVQVRLAFSKSAARRLNPRSRSETMKTLGEALTFYQAVFGPYPLGELSVVTVDRSFSQSFLGFITLSDAVFEGRSGEDWRTMRPVREQTVAHEVAHQWWGNLVGWKSYRDQWLSEAMANYAAMLYVAYRGSGDASGYLAALAEGWRWSLGQRTKDGRTIESVGPLVLGERLNSSKGGEAYQPIVYRKGAVVLSMLARSFSQSEFLGMLNALVDAARHRVLETDSFIRAFEHMSGRDLDEFASRYIYGTGIPDVYYSYEAEPTEGAADWLIRGEAHQVSPRRYVHRVARSEAGTWDVRREPVDELDVSNSTMSVPVRVELEGMELRGERKRRWWWSRKRRERELAVARFEGVLDVRGRREAFEIRVPARPRLLELDPRGEVLANFYSEGAAPKLVLHHRARAAAERGEFDLAEETFARALLAEPSEREDVGRAVRRTRDARIHMDLARLHLDRGRVSKAADAIREAQRVLPGSERFFHRLDLAVLEARLDLLAGRPDKAHDRLDDLEDQIRPRDGFASWRAYAFYLQLHSQREALAEAIALLAVTATLTDDPETREWARREAVERGCDLSALDALATPGPEAEARSD